MTIGEPRSPGLAGTANPKRELFRAELERATSRELADIYWGAVLVLGQSGNAERLAMAGHSLRELQNALPAVLDVPEARDKMNLDEEFPGFADKWEAMGGKTRCRTDAGDWAGEIDGPLARFLRKFDDLVQRFRDRNPRMTRVSDATLRRLDPALDSVPAETAKYAVSAWLRIRRTFVDFAHHKQTDAGVFDASIAEFEALLGDRLFPRTFEKQAQIVALVQEAERGAADS